MLVLKRAAELQQENGIDGRRSTLDELEVAAEEAGIDRALVRRAATEIRRVAPVQTRDNAFVGGPTIIVLEGVVDGEVGPEGHEHLVNAIRRHTSEPGRHDVLGKTLTWQSTPAPAQGAATRFLTVTITPRGGVTTIRVEEKLSMLVGVLFGAILGGVGGGGSSFAMMPFLFAGMPALIPVAIIGWVGGVYAIVRRLYARKSQARRQQLEELLAELVAIAEECVAESPPGD